MAGGAAGLGGEPLRRLGNYAAAGVCAVAAYEILFLAAAFLVFVSGSVGAAIALGFAYLLLYVVLAFAGIPFIIWFHRAYKSLRLRGVETRFTPGWAIGCWFIPFANWVLPGMIGDEIWRAGRHPDQPGRADGWNLAWAWWAIYIGSGLLGYGFLFLFGFGIDERRFAFTLIVATILLLLSAAFAIAFVRRASERLDTLASIAPPGDGLDRTISSVYEMLPIPAGLAEAPAGVSPSAGTAAQVPARAPEAPVACAHCGALEAPGANFCGACGAPQRG